jgi:sRNA-binding protein
VTRLSLSGTKEEKRRVLDKIAGIDASGSKGWRQTQRMLAFLRDAFPKAFPPEGHRPKPLKIGIHLDILERTKGTISERRLARALRHHVSDEAYLDAGKRGEPRVDLDGRIIETNSKNDEK